MPRSTVPSPGRRCTAFTCCPKLSWKCMPLQRNMQCLARWRRTIFGYAAHFGMLHFLWNIIKSITIVWMSVQLFVCCIQSCCTLRVSVLLSVLLYFLYGHICKTKTVFPGNTMSGIIKAEVAVYFVFPVLYVVLCCILCCTFLL